MPFLTRWTPAAATAAAIFWLSHQSLPPGTGWAPDWLGHFIVYGILAATLVWGVTDRLREPLTARKLCLVIALATAYGVSDEAHQSFIPNRNPAVWDVVADFLGAAAAAAAIFAVYGSPTDVRR